MLDGHGNRGLSVIGRPPRHHFVHHNAQRVQVRPVVRVTALGLLRGNVVNAAQGFLGQGVALIHHPGDAEVHDLHGAVFQHHHVMRLDVPVDNAPAVGVLQALGNLQGEMQGLLPVEDALFLHIFLQGNAVDELHDDVVRPVGGGNVIDLNDVRVAEHGHSLALRPEPAAELLIPGKFVFQNFNRNQSVQPMAASFINNGHAAGTDDLKNLVPTVQKPSNILIHISSFPAFG